VYRVREQREASREQAANDLDNGEHGRDSEGERQRAAAAESGVIVVVSVTQDVVLPARPNGVQEIFTVTPFRTRSGWGMIEACARR